jgi:hypothetical protein
MGDDGHNHGLGKFFCLQEARIQGFFLIFGSKAVRKASKWSVPLEKWGAKQV